MNPRAAAAGTVSVMQVARAALVTAAVLGSVALAGCGSSSKTSAETTSTSPTATWANGVCSAAQTYKTSLQNASATVKSGSVSKSALQDAAKKVTAATDTFVSSLHGLGEPGTAAGQAAKKTVDDLASQLQKDAQAITDAAAGSSSALTVISVVSTTLVTAKGQITSAIDDLKQVDAKGELQAAFSTAPACAALKGV
jgi:hypothetical protein